MAKRRKLPTQDELKAALDYEPATGILRWRERPDCRPEWNTRYAGKIAGHLRAHDGYVGIMLDGVLYMAHRLAWVWVYGSIPEGLDVDHRRGRKNRLLNLRLANSAQNNANSSARSTESRLKGAYRYCKAGAWRGQITVHGKPIHLGVFDTAEGAHAAYMQAAKKHFGAFART